MTACAAPERIPVSELPVGEQLKFAQFRQTCPERSPRGGVCGKGAASVEKVNRATSRGTVVGYDIFCAAGHHAWTHRRAWR